MGRLLSNLKKEMVKLNKTKITATVCALVLTAGIGIPVFAANTSNSRDVLQFKQGIELTDEQKAELEAKRGDVFKQVRELTDEQKAEFEAKRAEMEAKMTAQKEKWEGLTDEQKSEIYSLKDQIADLEGKVVDKYAEFGIYNAEDVTAQKESISENKAKMRESGEMPMMRGGFGKDGNRICGGDMQKGEAPSN